LDEFDAVARTRGRSDDVGELDRVVISLLQELDHHYAFLESSLPLLMYPIPLIAPSGVDLTSLSSFRLPSRADLRRFLTRFENTRSPIPSKLRSYADVEKWAIDRRRSELLKRFSAKHGKARRT
jgi:hypothetical protein